MKPSLENILNLRKNKLKSIKLIGLDKVLGYDGVIEDTIYRESQK